MVNIKAAQYKIISDYASSCLTDIGTCYNDQVSQVTSWSATAAVSSVYNIMRGACRNVALTCGYAVFSEDTYSCPTSDPDKCIESISEIFYQSLLCPDNSEYSYSNSASISQDNTPMGRVNKLCRCREGYVSFRGACLPVCTNGGVYLSTGVCGEAKNCNSVSHGVEATGTDVEFWGHCKCDGNYHWYAGACVTCPSNSTYSSTAEGEIYDGMCKCNSTYFKWGSASCTQCPSDASYNANWSVPSQRCTCPEGKSYNASGNCCGTTSSGSNNVSCANQQHEYER